VLKKTIEVTMLYDFYGRLLTERQRQFVELYYHHDLSLGEIAENTGVTRQAVYDILQRAERGLRGYEKALELLMQHKKRQQALTRCRELLHELRSRVGKVDRARALVDEVLRALDEELS